MSTEMTSKVIESGQSFLAPLVKTNKLTVGYFEKMVDFQMDSLQFYTDMVLDRLKAAVEVNDSESLQDFLSGQFEVAATMAQKMMDDAKALAELSAGFQTDLNEQLKENASELTDKTAKVTKHTAGKAAKVTKETSDKAAKETSEAIHKTA